MSETVATTGRLRRTPCVGICSTTYGDLVCRGCKRYAHEIVGWNGFSEQQRELVWDRLQSLLAEVAETHLAVTDRERLRRKALEFRLPDAEKTPDGALAFQLLRMAPPDLAAIGVTPRGDDISASPRDLVRVIDRDFYERSTAHYERSFKIRAD